jgi:uncharacterized protein YndB with AHSA1/START domain
MTDAMTIDSVEDAHDGSLERELTIGAPPATVFSYFTDPDRLTTWMGRKATLDPRPGGSFRIEYNDHDVARGEYLVIDPPHRLVLSWGWEAEGSAVPPGASRVEIDLAPDGAGTRLTLRHLGLPADEIPTHAQGWDLFLPGLPAAAAA